MYPAGFSIFFSFELILFWEENLENGSQVMRQIEVVNMHAFLCCSYFALKSLSFSLVSFVVPNTPFDPIGFELKIYIYIYISIRKY